jgi:hypothetical protein
MTVRRIRLPRPPKIAAPPLAPECPEPVVWHELGGWTVGWCDSAPVFLSRAHATAVAIARTVATP